MELNDEQRDDIRNFLIGRGLAFKPLLEEMSDHIGCDLEDLMKEGMSYEDAWKQTIHQLPADHFKLIQQETMETINSRFNLSRIFTWGAMAAMFGATIFKLFHLRGANELLLVSFMAIAGSLLSSSVSGIYFNRERKGAIRVMAIVSGVILMMTGYSFKLLHLAGADQIITLAAIVSVVSIAVHTAIVNNTKSSSGNLFTFLHEKYSPGIERFLLVVLVMAVLSAIVLKLVMLHIVVIYAAGLQLIALMIRATEQNSEHRNVVNLFLIVTAFASMTTPMLGELVPFSFRVIAIILFNALAVILMFRMDSSKKPAVYIAGLVAVIFTAAMISKLGLISFPLHNLFVAAIVSAIIVVGLFISQKNSITRTFLILSLSGYILEAIVL